MDSSTSVTWEEWTRIEKERQRESDRLRVFDLARRLRVRTLASDASPTLLRPYDR